MAGCPPLYAGGAVVGVGSLSLVGRVIDPFPVAAGSVHRVGSSAVSVGAAGVAYMGGCSG